MTINKLKPDLIIALGLVFTAVILWWQAPAFQPRFGSLATVSASIGQILALAGTVLLAINFVLSARLRIIEKLLNGLNHAYQKHSQTGQLALILLLFHPLFLIPKYASDIRGAAAFLWFSQNLARNAGIFALGVMIALIALTLYLRPKYHIWKWTHKFLGLALMLAGLHVWLVPSDTSRYLPLRVYMLAVLTIGLFAYLYRSIFSRWLIKKYYYAVTAVVKLNAATSEIRLKPRAKKINYRPGQFIFISFIDHKLGLESHPFSLTSVPADDYLSFSVKNLGDYTSKISQIKPGIIARIEGPFGTFSFQNTAAKSQIWIAGGIGITPFVGLAKALPVDAGYQVDLIYCVKNKDEAVHLEDLRRAALASNGALKVRPFYSDEQGRFSVESIKDLLGNKDAKDLLICAPPAMISAIRGQLKVQGVNQKHIYSEEFSF